MKCKGPECNRTELVALGLCAGHYTQQHRGNPLTPLRRYGNKPVGPDGYNYCIKCETFKKYSEFYVRKSGGFYTECKPCKRSAGSANYRARQLKEETA